MAHRLASRLTSAPLSGPEAEQSEKLLSLSLGQPAPGVQVPVVDTAGSRQGDVSPTRRLAAACSCY